MVEIFYIENVSKKGVKTNCVYVQPETVGQFTGLHDKEGREIFEGGIIELVNNRGETIRVCCEFGTHQRYLEENLCDITGFAFIFEKWPTFPIVKNYTGKHDLELFEVIGNIHDNPELLTTK
jgi:uncharacterized phage protein (TIGR01671 family)